MHSGSAGLENRRASAGSPALGTGPPLTVPLGRSAPSPAPALVGFSNRHASKSQIMSNAQVVCTDLF